MDEEVNVNSAWLKEALVTMCLIFFQIGVSNLPWISLAAYIFRRLQLNVHLG